MNPTFESALDYMDEPMLANLKAVLALDMPLVMVTSTEPAPPGYFYLLPGEGATREQMQQFSAIMQSGEGEVERLTPADQREMLETVTQRLSQETGDDYDDNN